LTSHYVDPKDVAKNGNNGGMVEKILDGGNSRGEVVSAKPNDRPVSRPYKAFAEERDRKQLVLFPVRIDDSVMNTSEPWARKLRDQRNIGDFGKWKDHDAYQKSLNRLLRDLTVRNH
jgi:hypothetical protein